MAVVLVTGGSSGIGLATVARLVAAGERVFSLARRSCPVDGATSINGDLRDRSVATAAVERALDDAGRLDALVSNAGHGRAAAARFRHRTDVVRFVTSVRFFRTIRLCRRSGSNLDCRA